MGLTNGNSFLSYCLSYDIDCLQFYRDFQESFLNLNYRMRTYRIIFQSTAKKKNNEMFNIFGWVAPQSTRYNVTLGIRFVELVQFDDVTTFVNMGSNL
jgi:hypothetical protein